MRQLAVLGFLPEDPGAEKRAGQHSSTGWPSRKLSSYAFGIYLPCPEVGPLGRTAITLCA